MKASSWLSLNSWVPLKLFIVEAMVFLDRNYSKKLFPCLKFKDTYIPLKLKCKVKCSKP